MASSQNNELRYNIGRIGMFYDKVSSVLYSLFFDRAKVLPKLWQYTFVTLT
jgi:hypothetical protein